MADSVHFPWMPFPPRFLVCTRDDIYEDENGRQWVVAKVETSRSPYGSRIETCITVHLQHMTTIPQEPTPQQPINNNSLPTMWRLESMNTYTGTDGTYWRLLDHSQMGDTLQLILDIVICEVD
ncbi:protein TCL1B3 [Mus musculus]|uniref:Protein TCL1B3 n=2 Tax=Mus musculus TaxID=10090 RepID=TCLB3_MOUSE|nr:protein TCL1B3 [Mus musculus]P56842.1 RecName: Full=Protein TCL1B3 [Mus musculus]AAF12803.1 T-cell leukemia protein Tcl1b3 [Mus musculus]AAI19261.1 T-cell leukemia/lymphoma 1B, 3 [Mus musculus]AAI20576.1 T-cell leukemia/lymphoma 1B, 3 [Mus musculus]EDL18768.1 mCG1148, isoform CRA_b [Mus musculus]|eukprot:NP_038800.1 protein TCL1B3 [Mus musculus]